MLGNKPVIATNAETAAIAKRCNQEMAVGNASTLAQRLSVKQRHDEHIGARIIAQRPCTRTRTRGCRSVTARWY